MFKPDVLFGKKFMGKVQRQITAAKFKSPVLGEVLPYALGSDNPFAELQSINCIAHNLFLL